jgi:hypothetical protein
VFHQPQGIVARFHKHDGALVHSSDEVLFEGRVRIPVIVSRRR